MALTNLKKAKILESDYKGQILKLQKSHKGLNKLSLFIYGNTATLKSMLRRAKKSSPLKLMTYYIVLQDYDLAQKKARGNAVPTKMQSVLQIFSWNQSCEVWLNAKRVDKDN